MTKKELFYILSGVLVGALFMWVFLANLVNSNNVFMMGMMGMDESSDIDKHFIEQMVPHHEDALTMSKIALRRAKRPEVRNLAVSITDSQRAEIEQMKAWYKEWFGEKFPTGEAVMKPHGMVSMGGMHMGTMGDETDARSLENAEDFDKAFLEHMIPHHQMAVMMADMLENSTKRGEMRTLSSNIVEAQNKEIQQMRTWLKNWK